MEPPPTIAKGAKKYRLGFFGPPGAGKSALVAALRKSKQEIKDDPEDDGDMPKILDLSGGHTEGKGQGCTKEPEIFPGITVGTKELELVDFPGTGDPTTSHELITMIKSMLCARCVSERTPLFHFIVGKRAGVSTGSAAA